LVETNLSSDKQIAVFFKKQLFSHDLEWNWSFWQYFFNYCRFDESIR
jgi:hypothetical protein